MICLDPVRLSQSASRRCSDSGMDYLLVGRSQLDWYGGYLNTFQFQKISFLKSMLVNFLSSLLFFSSFFVFWYYATSNSNSVVCFNIFLGSLRD